MIHCKVGAHRSRPCWHVFHAYTGYFTSPSGNPDNNLESLSRPSKEYYDSKLLSVFPEGRMNYPLYFNVCVVSAAT
jgi:hypothetical protein